MLGGLVLALFDRPWPMNRPSWGFLAVWVSASALWLLFRYLRHPSLFREAVTPRRSIGAVLVVTLVGPFQVTFQSLKQSILPLVPFRWDSVLAELDAALHGGDAWRLVGPLIASAHWVRVVDALYMLWFLLLIVTVIWVSWTRYRALRLRTLVAILLLWIGGGTVAAAVSASAGPCYYEAITGDRRYAPLLTQLDSHVGTDGQRQLLARRNQEAVWAAAHRGDWHRFGGVSAMPSLHVGFSVLMALVGWQVWRPVGWLLGVYAVSIQIGSVALAWHYAVDGYAGALVAYMAWLCAGMAAPSRSPGAE
jgi:hypothetical protein